MNPDLIAIVAIGRNEGERLRRCLSSIRKASRDAVVIYVDSGSIDSSVQMAIDFGCDVVNLDLTIPFTAARARNTGFTRAIEVKPTIMYVQFVDGDCEISDSWLSHASDFLDQNSSIVAVCGRRRERYPERSIYNQLCDSEWDTPIGRCLYFGGDVLIRAECFLAVGGYRDDLIAGEEPELCVRLRAKHWVIWRLDEEMTIHDAAIFHFHQWWTRTLRAGYAYAQGVTIHGASTERHFVREALRAILWACLLPVVILIASSFNFYFSLAFLIYPLQVVRLSIKAGPCIRFSWIRSLFTLLAKFPEFFGIMRFIYVEIFRVKSVLIEYK